MTKTPTMAPDNRAAAIEEALRQSTVATSVSSWTTSGHLG